MTVLSELSSCEQVEPKLQHVYEIWAVFFECLISMNSCWHRFFCMFSLYSYSHVMKHEKTAMVSVIMYSFTVKIYRHDVQFFFLIHKNQNGPWTSKTVWNDIARLNSVALNNNNKCLYEFCNFRCIYFLCNWRFRKLPANYTKNNILIGF